MQEVVPRTAGFRINFPGVSGRRVSSAVLCFLLGNIFHFGPAPFFKTFCRVFSTKLILNEFLYYYIYYYIFQPCYLWYLPQQIHSRSRTQESPNLVLLLRVPDSAGTDRRLGGEAEAGAGRKGFRPGGRCSSATDRGVDPWSSVLVPGPGPRSMV